MGCCCCGASAIDAEEAAAKVKEEAPEILIDGEKFEFAFAFTRDQVYFTSARILMQDKQGFTGSSVAWKSYPYSSIKAFAVQTAGTLDFNMLLTIWCGGISNGDFTRDDMMPSPALSVSFSKQGGIDVMALQRFLNGKVFNPGEPPMEIPPQPEGMQDVGTSEFMDLILGDAKAIDPKIVEAQLRVDPAILLPDETVDMAFRSGRDTTALTSRRVLYIDVQGLTGRRVNYRSYHWSCIKAFAVQTPGAFLDRDCELLLWTTISHTSENRFQLDLRNSSTDILAIQRYFSDKVLGEDTMPPSAQANSLEGQEDGGGGWQAWLAGDMRMLDAVEENRKFHEDIPMLQGSEACEMAFKGARDMVLFTTKRLIVIDPKGLTGKKVSYTSIPWSCVQAFAVQSAGSFIDKDSEMMIWTDIFHDYDTEQEEYEVGDETHHRTVYIPTPGLSYISIDFQKDKVDLGAVGRYLASRCAVLGSQSSQPATPMPDGLLEAGEPGLIEMFFNWLGDDYRQVDPNELDEKLHSECSMLLPDEHVQMGFLCGRDTMIMTTHRAMKIDTKGFTGNRVLYLSVPYTKVKSYKVESAGSWDLDAKMSINIKAPWYAREIGSGLNIDFGKGRADIVAVNKFLSEQVIGTADGSSVMPREALPEAPEGVISAFLDWLGDDYHQIPAEDVTQKMTGDPAIFLPDETVDLAFKCGRDLMLFTTKRFMKVDTQGWTGKRVAYESLPYSRLHCFVVTGAASHPFDRDAEIKLHADDGYRGFDVKKDQGDIMAVYTFLNNKCILDRALT